MLSLNHISLTRGTQLILNDVSLTIEPGQSLCIVGPNGSGKSTLLRICLGEEQPTLGTVLVDHVDLGSLPHTLLQVYRQSTGVLFSQPLCIPEKTIIENIMFIMEAIGTPRKHVLKRTQELVEWIGLAAQGGKQAIHLTTVEQQKLALARAVANQPKILFADDPCRALDAEGTAEFTELLRSINTSDLSLVLTGCDDTLAQALGIPIFQLIDGSLARATQTEKTPSTKEKKVVSIAVE